MRGFGFAATLARRPPQGQVAQLVEQRIENPRVDGSIPPLATSIHAGSRALLVEIAKIRVQFFAHGFFLAVVFAMPQLPSGQVHGGM